MKKRCFIIAVLCILALTACTNKNPVIIDKNSEPDKTTTSTAASSEQSTSKQENSTSSVTESESSSEQTESSAVQSSDETSTESTSSESTSSNDDNSSDEENHWTETEYKAEMYVQESCYSRNEAIIGADTVKKYSVNDTVSVVAKTDTEYYKLDDGSFIHFDFLGTEKVEEKPVDNPTPEYPKVPEEVSKDRIKVIDGVTYIDGILIANKTYALPSTYNPGEDYEASNALQELFEAGAAEGYTYFINSGFRSYDSQYWIYWRYVSEDGQAEADRYSARPGHSEHQTGLAFDLNSFEESWGDTPEGKWLAENCHKFGFIIRYTKNKESVTGYIYEPWHVRYLGKDVATKVYNSGLCLEEYLGISSYYHD